MMFLKPNTSVIGPGEPIVYPTQTQAVDHEAELAIVIGRICKDVPAERVGEVIFGYTAANDVSARDLQSADGQWGRAKGFDTFCPLGPWIVTHLGVAEASDLGIRATLPELARTLDAMKAEGEKLTLSGAVRRILDQRAARNAARAEKVPGYKPQVFAAFTARLTSEPVAMMISSGVPSQSWRI